MDETAFLPKVQVCRLGVFLVLDFLLDKQLVVVVQGTFCQLWLESQLWHFLGEGIAFVVHTLLIFRLIIAMQFNLELPLKSVWKLQLVQKLL